ncbi:dual specificity protein kinase kns1 [Mortierella alpina]|uniref:Dual specificity protein kinase kns1 n=1 Tax=Mortierella alpina TaxID=64518 RepID=A0A9P6J256_MORAP|nr:dual specificity protein kinase kns1 [Mortierella alpina]
MTMTTTRIQPGKRSTNWTEFYKNGLPQEVIVIDDDTPPPQGSSSSASSSTSSHHHHQQVPSSRRHDHSSHYDHYQRWSSPRSHVMPPPPPTSYGLASHHSHPSTSAYYAESHGRAGSRRSNYSQGYTNSNNKRPPSTGPMSAGSNGSYSYHPSTSSAHNAYSEQRPHPSYCPHPGGHDASHHNYPPYAYPSPNSYSSSHHRPAYPQDSSPLYSSHNASAYYRPASPARKRRRSNADVKYIAPPPPPLPRGAQENYHAYSNYHPAANGPSAANISPAANRDAPAIIPPWDDKEGHYIVVPNEDLTSRYKIIRLLGQGTFGKVVECYDRQTGRHCAIKIIRAVQKYRDASKIETRVLNTLKRNDPRNAYKCLHLKELFDHRNHVCMVFELLGQSIYDWLKDNAFCPFPAHHIQQFAKQLLTSVAFLHRLRLIHTDLKPENILLVNGVYRQLPYKKDSTKIRRVLLDPEIRLIDFGSATFQDEHHSSVVCTRHYRAPEIILGLGWSYPCDIWSIGCILVEFLTGEALFQTHDNLEHLAMMEVVLGPVPDKLIRAANKSASKYFVHGRLDFPNDETKRNSRKYVKALRPLKEYVSPTSDNVSDLRFASDFVDLLRRLLAYDPNDRISASQALRHPYFNYILDESGQVVAMKK